MYTSTVLFAIVASFATFVVATPPACLIAAVEMQADPSNYKAICGSLASEMVGNMTKACAPANKQAAISAYSSLCLAQGVTVSIPAASSTQTGPASSSTGTSGSLTTGAGLIASTSTPTGSGPASSATGKNAGSSIAPQSAFFIAPILLGASFVGQYLL